jgi:hypothetical protein
MHSSFSDDCIKTDFRSEFRNFEATFLLATMAFKIEVTSTQNNSNKYCLNPCNLHLRFNKFVSILLSIAYKTFKNKYSFSENFFEWLPFFILLISLEFVSN